ncbi:hypothetical protein AYR62_13070 [Secundilactobacillus paracollinoides]|uniref:HTH marR-type domain-containing protein n=3 Tax=Secundilactobacillus paracollinoides TaxID=240427 RepID=A0A1B2IWM8_9LACO|nr:MarR family transcriptional regulator [Secundilactobacillus paracollinoides]ANZ60578.1 hypothetical protein AYR61_03935 [Secundilactobacillus paracollinoides]ANZ64912.1 hypothetical protein AYR62_13070 [Secundilactobacillus paracollinoides]ANZ66429.1 hypothetical protein AYR63_04295 [Secundilactobacillus paracollinoides]
MVSNGELINDLMRAISINQRRMVESKLREVSPMTPEQSRALQMIGERPGIIQRELADLFHRRSASVSNLLQNLERDGYIVRKRPSNNGRNKQIFLTQKGTDELATITAAFNRGTQNVEMPLTTDEQVQLIGLLQKIARSQGGDE